MIYNLINLISIIIIIFSIIIFLYKNVMISLFNLILLYISLAIFLYLNNLNVIGLLYLLIYVGPISVLYIFILSLINIKNEEINLNKYQLDLLIILNIFILFIIIYNLLIDIDYNNLINIYLLEINLNNLSNNIEFKTIGELLYTEYSFIFIILGFILLLSIIGGILLIKRINRI